jgi:hypothetical protein
MKKVSLILLFLTLSLTGFAQQEPVASSETEFIDTPKTVKPEASKSSISAAIKAEILKMNRKKSNEIISIKAYRKSLQIKVKTVKLC